MSYVVKNDVLCVDEQWYFLFGGNHSPFDFYTGKKKINKSIIDAFNENIESRNNFCKLNKILYAHIIFPAKAAVMRELLISEFPEFNYIHNEFLNHNSVLYPLDVVSNCDEAFYKTDTHNTPIGSWLILKYLLAFLKIKVDLEPKFIKSSKVGDLTKMYGVSTPEVYQNFVGFNDVKYAGFDKSNRSALIGNTGEMRVIRNFRALLDKRVLIFADSFVNESMLEQMSWIFREVFYIRSSNFIYEIIDFVEPDIILSGQAERYLSSVTADNNREFFFAKYLISDMINYSLLPKGFNRALNAMLSFKNTKNYLDWCSDVDAYMKSKSL